MSDDEVRVTPYEAETQSVPEARPVDAMLAELERLSHDDLQAVHDKAKALIDDRAQERQKAAIQEIQEIARKHGLNVDVKGPRKRRGRPPKNAKGG